MNPSKRGRLAFVSLLVILLPPSSNQSNTTTATPKRIRSPLLPDHQEVLVQVSHTCVEKQEEAAVSFSNLDARENDWIGIYPDDYHATEEPVYWVHSCGTDSCNQAVTKGSVTIPVNLLNPGIYKAVLAQDNPDSNETYHIVGESAVFTVVRHKCTHSSQRQLQSSRMATVIEEARDEIWALMESDISLPGRYLRMAFHDCIGGRCDGCIHMDNGEHAGIEVAMESLRHIAIQFRDDLSRADIWALAAFVGVEFMMPDDDSIRFPFNHYGRNDCPGSDMRGGPDPFICGPNMGTNAMLAFFESEYGFSGTEIAAIMGAHTIGVMRRDVLGFDGRNGWVADNLRFDNEYHQELIGRGGDVSLAPNWLHRLVKNENGLPDRRQWVGFPGGKQVTMMNSDIALVRQLDSSNKSPEGDVDCSFISRGGSNICPPATSTLLEPMIRFASDNRIFLRGFHSAMVKMIDVGYEVDDETCDSNNVCQLRSRD